MFNIALAAERDSGQAAPLDPHSQVYAGKTDQQLTELTAQWDALDDSERRALLIEVKARMEHNEGRDVVIRILTQRRYGRIIRRSDGSVVRIETQVVRVRPAGPGTQPYGVGFEQRAARKEAEQKTAPVLTVKDPSP